MFKKFVYTTLWVFWLVLTFIVLQGSHVQVIHVPSGGAPPAGGTEILRPVSDVSKTGISTSSGTSDRWTMVDESVSDGDTTFIYAEDRNLYYRAGMETTSLTTETITSVTLKAIVRCGVGDSTVMGITTRKISTSTSYYYIQETVGSSYTEISETWTTNPSTSSAWVPSDIAGFGFGVYQTSLDRTFMSTQIWLEVEYE
jgi:hypothetical protein